MSSTTELNLQIGFGVFGIMGTIATLAGLYHRDSLGCILIRRLVGSGTSDPHNEDVESGTDDLSHIDSPIDADVGCERRSTLPPSYEQSNEDSEAGSVDDAFHETGVSNSRRR